MNHLGLSGIVQILRDTFGGKYLLHLHCLPWKYTNKNTDRYRRLHSLYQNERYDDFKKEEDTGFDYHKPDKIICVSDSAKCYLEKVHKIASSKISKIYNGIDIDAFQQPRNDLTILYAGRITKDKGILDFLDAVSEVVRSTDYFPRIKLAGYFNIPQFFIKKKYQHLDIEFLHQIDFNELKILYANSTFGVIPSLHEQCSYVAIEMAAFGLPLIVSDVDALSEIFEDRKTALFNKLVFNSDGELCADKDMFVNNIIEMIENEKLRQTISINLKNLYDDKFRSAAMRELTFRSYEGLFEK
jgi:glycosyltransferase involved in cell wall biosynthesis